jgi:hypothetical protein
MKVRASQFLANERMNPSPISEKRSERPPTVFHAIYQSSLPTEEKSLTRLSQEGLVMLVAGSESTSRSLMLATYYLLSNPSILARLREELDLLMPDSSVVPTVKTLEALPLLVSSFEAEGEMRNEADDDVKFSTRLLKRRFEHLLFLLRGFR